jgi:hypothetical protein
MLDDGFIINNLLYNSHWQIVLASKLLVILNSNSHTKIKKPKLMRNMSVQFRLELLPGNVENYRECIKLELEFSTWKHYYNSTSSYGSIGLTRQGLVRHSNNIIQRMMVAENESLHNRGVARS